MALHYDLNKIKNNESVCWIGEGEDEHMNPVTHALIWATLFTGIGEITEKSAAEFYARLKVHERLHGAMLTESVLVEGKDVHRERFITPEDVRLHVGLRTNAVSAAKTRKQWEKGRLDSLMDRWTDEYKKPNKEKEVTA